MEKLLQAGDMARIGCRDCQGCSLCCHDMGQSILLDPYDIYVFETRQMSTLTQMISGGYAELHVEEGLIIPNLKMTEPSGGCGFLTENGRCSIHANRPGICRLFPLGRNYSGDKLEYFVLEDACPAKNKTKIKVGRWLEMERPAEYQAFLVKWHELKKRMYQLLASLEGQDKEIKQTNLLFLQLFFMKAYDERDFYEQFEERWQTAQQFFA